MPKPWVVWIHLLVAANLIAPWFFFQALEAQVVLGAFLFGAVTQMGLFHRKGFVRLLGIGHFLWLPMVVWLWFRLCGVSIDHAFAYWMTAVIILDGLSVLIDIADVVRYLRGERKPVLDLRD